MRVLVRRLASARDLPLPERATEHAAGFDLRAAVEAPLDIPPGGRVRVPTGIVLALPAGFEGQVRPRSGLAFRHGLILPNAPGTIDADYRGEVQVIVQNLGAEVVRVERGDRIAQLVVSRLPDVVLEESDALEETPRGAGGFGHTGRR